MLWYTRKLEVEQSTAIVLTTLCLNHFQQHGGFSKSVYKCSRFLRVSKQKRSSLSLLQKITGGKTRVVPLYLLQIGNSRSKLTSHHSATNNKQQEITMQSRVSLFTLITFISCASCAIPFYKYGSGAGDSRLPMGANPSVGLTLPESYTFYGVEYSRIFVSLYGVPVYRITGVR